MQQLSLFPPQADFTDLAGRPSNRDDTGPSPSELPRHEVPLPERDRARLLDQYYTCDDVVEALLDWYRVKRIEHNLCRFQHTCIIEPSAGAGAFLRKLPLGSIGYDVEPKAPGIIQGDFLTMPLPADGALLVIGNPPFGKNASMAIRFFNHAAQAADVVAFIVPLTFQKVSVQKRLDLSFHLLDEMPVPKDAFIFEGKRKHVPSVFQIWVRSSSPRQKLVLPTSHPDFAFLAGPRIVKADFAIQRVGANAGRVHHNLQAKPAAHYFIKAAPGIFDLETVMKKLDFKQAAQRSSGNPSLAKTELVQLYAQFRNSRQDKPARNPNRASPARHAKGEDPTCG